MRIRIKRVYDPPAAADGYRVLVDRLWPRGVSKADAALGEWAKELAPGDGLRKWFGHDPEKWPEFRRRYLEELAAVKQEVAALIERSPRKTITLLFGAKDTAHNNAVVLKEFIEANVPG
jgi:uncharacterized protein YeaO (DUF488 family)